MDLSINAWTLSSIFPLLTLFQVCGPWHKFTSLLDLRRHFSLQPPGMWFATNYSQFLLLYFKSVKNTAWKLKIVHCVCSINTNNEGSLHLVLCRSWAFNSRDKWLGLLMKCTSLDETEEKFILLTCLQGTLGKVNPGAPLISYWTVADLSLPLHNLQNWQPSKKKKKKNPPVLLSQSRDLSNSLIYRRDSGVSSFNALTGRTST